MSLTSCLRKAGSALNAKDKAAVLEAARKYRAQGMSADAAGIKAIEDRLAEVQAMMVEAQKPKAVPALGRTRPASTIDFARPIIGPSGARLLSYTWQWKPMEFVDARGEERVKRISDWDASEASGDTGRDVVHQFVVDDNGTEKTVSAESALKLLGFAAGSDGRAEFNGLASAAKTLARLRMQQSELQQAKEQFDRDNAQVQALPLPTMPTERDGKGWFNLGDASVRQIEPGPMNDERRRSLIGAWRDNRLAERGWQSGAMAGETMQQQLREVAGRIKRQQAKVDKLAAAAPDAQPVAPTRAAVSGRARHPKTVMGSKLLALVSSALGGLSPSLLSEFSTRFETNRIGADGRRIVEWKNPLIPGVGRLFRDGGMADYQEIAELLEAEGYLAPGTVAMDEREAGEAAKEMIVAALNREEVQTWDERLAEQQRRAAEDVDQFEGATADFTPDELDTAGYTAADPAIQIAIDGLLSNAADAGIDVEALQEDAARMSEGQTQETYYATLKQLIDEAVAAWRGAGRADTEAAGRGGQDRSQAAGDEGEADPAEEGLTAPTPEGLRAADERARAAQEADRREQRRLEDRARADAERDEFVLTGSDRPADVAAAGGQVDLFAGGAATQDVQASPDPAAQPAAEPDDAGPASLRERVEKMRAAPNEPGINDRDHFTLERGTADNTMERVTFARGEYVTYRIGEGGRQAFGEIDGISHARREFSVDGLWHPFGFAYKAERPAAAPKKDAVPLSSVVDKVNAKFGAGLGPADAVSLLEAFKGTMRAVYDGTASVDDYKKAYRRVRDAVAVKAELGKLTKDELIRTFGIVREGKKDELIEIAYNSMLRGFALGKSYGPQWMTMGQEAAYQRQKAAALDAIVEAHTADDLAAYASEVKAEREAEAAKRSAAVEAIKNPKTLDEYRRFMSYHTRDGKSTTEVRLSMLTPEQRAEFDLMLAEETRSRRKVTTDDQRTSVRVAGQTVDGNIIATKHTKKGHDLYVVQLAERVSREDYETLNTGAKKIGGYYSSFRGGGAIPGFQFTTREQAQAFVTLAGGDATAAKDAAQARRDAYADDRSQTAAERLTEMAEAMESAADESLSRERKANTERRARFAAAAEAEAREAKAMAKTMRNVAEALTSGKAKFLDRIRTKTQVQLLQTYVANAKGDELRAKFPTYAEQEKRKGQPPTAETADYAEFPTFTAYRSDLASLGRQLSEVDGTKQMGQSLMKVADDVTDAFTAWVKEPGNYLRVAAFSNKGTGDRAGFSTKDGAERAIARSGYRGKAIPWSIKRGEWTVILSPSEAVARGLWTGDGDKRITLDATFGAELVEKIGRANRRGAKVSVPWQFERAHERRKQLQRMGIETPAEFRAALREFIGLREQAAEADRIKALERAMIGRRNDGLDFFPTPESVADEMVAAADIRPDMAVLEPSAGMGHIADRIRAAGAEPDVIEMASDRRELLQEKGYTLQGSDFLALKPREFFTYGDVFRAPDGVEGIMRGGNSGMGSDRVTLVSEDGRAVGAGFYNRSELVGVRHRGTDSGYDRILMNPPFSDGRDIEHVRHAYSLLKPGGRIVAIMGESAFTNQNKRATEFREWLESVGGTEEKLPEGTFMDPNLPVNTGANARMVVIDKSEAAQFSRSRPAVTADQDENGRPVMIGSAVELRFGQPTERLEVIEQPGEEVLHFPIMASEGFDVLGHVVLLVKDGQPASLIDIEVYGKGQGVGRAAIETLLAAYPDADINISNIVPSARGFWEKMGVPQQNVEGAYDGTLNWETYQAAAGDRAGTGEVAEDGRGPGSQPFARGEGRGRGEPAAAPRAGKRLTRDRLADMVSRITANWANAPDIVVVDGMQDALVPEEVRREDQLQRSRGASGEPEGFFYKGKVYLVGAGLRTEADAVRVLFHETLGHAGLRGVFGAELGKVLDLIAAGRAADMQEMARLYGKDLSKPAERRYVAEEVLAMLAQTRPDMSLVQRAIAAIRNFLRRLGLRMELTDADVVANFILPARRWIERGGKQREAGVAAQFSRSQGPDIDRAWRDLIGSHRFSDFDTAAATQVTGTPDDFVLSRQQGEQWAALNAREYTRDDGATVLTSSLEVGDKGYRKGTGAATTMYLQALHIAKKRGLGWMSEGVRSDAARAIYRRLTEGGVPFKEEDGASYVTAADLAKVDLEAVAEKIADGRPRPQFSRSFGEAERRMRKALADQEAFMADPPGWFQARLQSVADLLAPLGVDAVQSYGGEPTKFWSDEANSWVQPSELKGEAKALARLYRKINSQLDAAEAGYPPKFMPVDLDPEIELMPRTDRQRVIDLLSKGLRGELPMNGESGVMFSRSIPDTLRERMNDAHAIRLPAGYLLGDLMKSSGKVSWWHKTVGTMHDLAQREPLFKPVYDRVQMFLNDVSFYASEASNAAESLLPRLETLADIGKSPLSAEDTQKISAPVFQGTLAWTRDEQGRPIKVETAEQRAQSMTAEQKAQALVQTGALSPSVLSMWQGLPAEQFEANVASRYESQMLRGGVVWTDTELQSMFGLDKRQIGLYREFRAAVDKSLTHMAASDMLRLAGADGQAITERVMQATSVEDAAQVLVQALEGAIENQPDRQDVLRDTAARVLEKAKTVRDLMARGYAPLMRFGRYTVDVTDADGERLYFGLFETEREANKMARDLRAEFPKATLKQGTLSEQQFKMFAGITPETAELFGNMLGLESTGDAAADRAFQEWLKLAKANRSAMKRLIQRKGIAGFSEDAGRVLASFVYSNARQTAKNLHFGAMSQAVMDISEEKGQGELLDAAVELHQYVSNPVEEAAGVRGLLFAQFLGGSIAAALVNMTQPVLVTAPYLSQWGGVAKASRRMTKALSETVAWETGRKTTGDARLDAAIKQAEEDGTISPQEIYQLMAQAGGTGALQAGDGTTSGDLRAKAANAMSKLMLAWGKPFSAAEQFNRRATFIAAYRTAVEEGIEDPSAFAKRAINDTQFVYNKGNRPAWARGAIGATLFTFKIYSISYVELMGRLIKKGPEGRRAALVALGTLVLVSGLQGLPGAEDLDDLIDGLAQRLGYNWSSKQAKREALQAAFGDELAQFLLSGVSGLPGAPIDVSNRLGMGNLIPGTGLFTKKADYNRDLLEILGPVGSLAQQYGTAVGKLAAGEPVAAVQAALPVAAQNVVKAVDMLSMGMYRDTRGRKVIDTDTTDAVFKAIGFQPRDVAQVQEAAFEQTRQISVNKLRETEIADKWARGIFEKDADKVREAREELRQWNEDNPDSPIRVETSQLLRRVKQMRMSREDRVAATAPAEIRAAVRRELEESSR
jgi:hypothetical protein